MRRVIASTSPTNWWLYGLIALAIVVALLFLLQLFNGAPGTRCAAGFAGGRAGGGNAGRRRRPDP